MPKTFNCQQTIGILPLLNLAPVVLSPNFKLEIARQVWTLLPPALSHFLRE